MYEKFNFLGKKFSRVILKKETISDLGREKVKLKTETKNTLWKVLRNGEEIIPVICLKTTLSKCNSYIVIRGRKQSGCQRF